MGKLKTLEKIGWELHETEKKLKKLSVSQFKTKGEKERFKTSKKRLKKLIDDIFNLYETGSPPSK